MLEDQNGGPAGPPPAQPQPQMLIQILKVTNPDGTQGLAVQTALSSLLEVLWALETARDMIKQQVAQIPQTPASRLQIARGNVPRA